MCIGIPMQVRHLVAGGAVCLSREGEPQQIDTSLVGPVAPGDWLMTFLGAARAVLTPEEAQHSLDALEALDRVMRGETEGFEHLFADLINRTPQLPDHLLPDAPAQGSKP